MNNKPLPKPDPDPDPDPDVLLLGEGAAGKTTIICVYKNIDFPRGSFLPTLLYEYEQVWFAFDDSKTYLLNILDSSGMDEYEEAINKKIQVSSSFLIVVRISHFSDFINTINDFLTYLNRIKKCEKPNPPIGVMINLFDQCNDPLQCSIEFLLKIHEFKHYLDGLGIPVYNVSLDSEDSIKNALNDFFRYVILNGAGTCESNP